MANGMRYTYHSLYHMRGLSPSSPSMHEEVFTNVHQRTKAVLTSDPSVLCDRLDTSCAIAEMLLAIPAGEEQKFESIDEKLANRVRLLRDTRARKYGSGVFLFFEANGETASFTPKGQSDCGSFLLALDGLPTNIRSQHEPLARKILAAGALAIESVADLEKLADSTTFFTDYEKPVYGFNFHADVSPLISRQTTADALVLWRELAAGIEKDEKLERIVRLLNDSLDPKQEKLHRFLSAWMGLEVFVNKNFPAYEKRVWDGVSKAVNETVREHYLKRIRKVMDDKYNPLNKFVVITADLDSAEADGNMSIFKRAKKFRDEFLHGELIDEKELPLTELQNLLRKFVCLHVQRSQSDYVSGVSGWLKRRRFARS